MSRRNHNPTLLLLPALAAALTACAQPDAPPLRADILPEVALPSAPLAAAGEGPAGADASTDASAAPDGSTSADASAPPPLPALADEPISDEKTKAPTKAEWASAPSRRLARVSDRTCSAKLVREWVRVSCEGYYHSISLVSGTRDALDVGVREGDPTEAFVIFPARKGDRRLILLQSMTKWSPVPSGLISEQWLDTDKGPIVTVSAM